MKRSHASKHAVVGRKWLSIPSPTAEELDYSLQRNIPWLKLDGSVGLGLADFDANSAANTINETSLLFSTSGGATVIAAHPDSPWAASGRVGVNFLHVGTSPDEVNQTKLDLTARLGRRMDWGPGGGAAYVGYIGSTALANAAVPGQDWTNQIEAGVVFALPN